MTIRTRFSVTAAALLIGAVTSACGGGGGGAPTDASESDFCDTQTSLIKDLIPDMSNPVAPSDEDMAKAVKGWGAKLEKVGTPKGISDDARKGFEAVVEQANDIDASDFSIDNLEELSQGGEDASAEVKKQTTAFSTYLTETCGDMMGDLQVPEIPEMPDSTE